jgi:FkbM family methyltransferase
MATVATAWLLDALRPGRLTAVVDVGANPIDGDPPYKAMLADGLCTVTGFEPQPAAFAQLLAMKGPHETYLPTAVGDGARHDLYIGADSGMTSLLRPDKVRLALFNGFEGWGTVIGVQPVDTVRLDDVAEIDRVDLLKIDVQGAELMVFQGGPSKLRRAVAVHTEVSFVALYEDQPTFGEVDAELRGLGFIPHALSAVKSWPIAPVVYDGDLRKPMHQLLEADVVYVRDFGRPELMDVEQLVHLALVAHCVYGSTDLAHRCLLDLRDRDAVAGDAPARYLSVAHPV